MKYAIIDTETNGLPDYKLPADDPSQPRLAALGVVMVDVSIKPEGATGQRVGDVTVITTEAEHEFLVKPEGWKMTPEASAVNGLTDERLAAEGLDASDVLSKYRSLITSGYLIVAYGAQHDCKVMRGEFRRRGLDDLFEETRNVCLMRALMGFKVPKANGKGGWPTLEDACRFFGAPVEARPHLALAGARAAFAVFSALVNKGALPEATVHHAKNPPVKPNGDRAAAPEPKVAPKTGDRRTQNGVELEFNGLQWLPVVNAANHPKLFNADGTRKDS